MTTEAGPRLQAAQLPPGSVLLLTGVDVEPAVQSAFRDEIAAAVGHEQFVVIIHNGPAGMAVWGPDVDLTAEIRKLIQAGTVDG